MHKSITFLITFLLNVSVFSQLTSSNADTKTIQIMEFVAKHLDSIKNTVPDANALRVEVEINEESFLVEKVNIVGLNHTGRLENSNIWNPMKTYVQNLFYFNPSFEFEEVPSISFVHFTVPLNKKLIKKEIKAIENSWTQECHLVDKNSNYTLTISHYFSNKSGIDRNTDTIKNFTISSRLEELNSEVIKLNENYFLIFRVTNTSYNGSCKSELILSIYSTRENKEPIFSQYYLEPGPALTFSTNSFGWALIDGDQKITESFICNIKFEEK